MRVLFGETHTKTFWRNKYWRLIISYMCLKLPLRVNFNVRVLRKWHGHVIDIEAKTPRGTCTYVDDSYILRHHVSKDFCN